MKIVTDETGLVLTPQDSRPTEGDERAAREPKRQPQPRPQPRRGDETGRKAA